MVDVEYSSGMPLLYGTIVFAGLCVLALLISWILARMGKNDYAKLSYPLIVTATVCMWLMWIAAWLHQWHPLIRPEVNLSE